MFDVSVLPSTLEGFGFSIVEAQALSVPVIGANIGGIKEVIDNNVTGMIFENFEANLLAEKIETLVSNLDFKNKIIETASKQVEEKFSLFKMVEGTERVYLDLLKK